MILIIGLAMFLRFWQLDRVPPSLSLDEVSIGYNAFSILETGRDEYGNRLPVLLRAYDDWRPALYVYLVIPFVKILGLTPLAVRFPAACMGILTVWLTYLLVKELFSGKLTPEVDEAITTPLALGSSLFLAVSPWHIYLTRLGHEVGAGLTFSVLAVWLFLRFINRKKPVWLFLSSVVFALSFYTYQSQKIFAPFLVLGLGLIFLKQVRRYKKELLLSILVGGVVLLPLLKATFSPGGLARMQGASIFTNWPETDQLARERVARDRLDRRPLGMFFDHPRLANSLYIGRAYLSHFDPVWLFFNKIGESHKVPGLGLFYRWQLPLLLAGGYWLVNQKFDSKTKALIVSWLFLGPLPAALSTQTPHGMRSLNILPMPQIIAALGLVFLANRVKVRKRAKRWILVLGGVLVFSLGYFYHHYFHHFPFEQADSFQQPLSLAMAQVLEIESKYDLIVFSERGQTDQSYMYFLFYSRTDPAWYQAQGGTTNGGFGTDHAFGKYEFRGIDWGQESQKPADGKTLYVGNMVSAFPDIPPQTGALKEFSLPDGTLAIKLVVR